MDLTANGGITLKSYRTYHLQIAAKGQCQSSGHRVQMAANWDYVGGQSGAGDLIPDSALQLPDDQTLKQALSTYGPIPVGVLAQNWDNYKMGVQLGRASAKQLSNPSSNEINHVVLLVGWDDHQGDHGVWFIKNSWGAGWGQQGFMTLARGTCNLGYGAVWVQARPVLASFPSAAVFQRLRALNLGLRL
jgi:cathepsin L